MRKGRATTERFVSSAVARPVHQTSRSQLRKLGVSSLYTRDESPKLGLSLKRSQRDSCSTEYNTPPGTQVVYRRFRDPTPYCKRHPCSTVRGGPPDRDGYPPGAPVSPSGNWAQKRTAP